VADYDEASVKAVVMAGWGMSIVIGAYDVPTARRKAIAVLDRLTEIGWTPPARQEVTLDD
jgi:hypothetical protein